MPARQNSTTSARSALAAVSVGNLAIPLVKALTAEVAKHDAEAARYVHWGATSQDIIDTALVLELRAVIDDLVTELDRAIPAFTTLAEKHRHTPTVGRTWLQQALPMPFGLKVAGYAAALTRARARLKRVRNEALVLQFGGATGTLAALGSRGIDVAIAFAKELDLPLPDGPWHTHRDRLADVASAFAMLAGTCGKIARDVSLLMQTEVGEAFEPAGEGRGASSTMPHKRNPVAAASGLACAAIAPQLCATILASAGAGARARGRRLGRRMADLPGARARHVGRARGRGRYRRRPRCRCRAHARQSRHHRRTDHGRSGRVPACRENRQVRRPQAGRRGEQEGACREQASARMCWLADPKVTAIVPAGEIVEAVRPDELSGRRAAIHRPPDRDREGRRR